ncbi:hypothetical protein [Zestomonas thermotolerans]|uniref:hypothetical protein n=1 Tax=Zestomonas thermotolerans TaxID=157784 RepID=UPI000361E500|nr:hypothetical protein [Pseudomonas thermotolerans]
MINLALPNWASSQGRISVNFRDDSLPFGDYDSYLAYQARCKIKQRLGLALDAYCR